MKVIYEREIKKSDARIPLFKLVWYTREIYECLDDFFFFFISLHDILEVGDVSIRAFIVCNMRQVSYSRKEHNQKEDWLQAKTHVSAEERAE